MAERVVKQVLATLGLAVVLGAMSLCSAPAALGYRVDLAWQHEDDAAGYRLYVRFGQESRDLSVDVGSVEVNESGEALYTLRRLPVGPTTYFSVGSYNARGDEGPRSNQLTIDYAAAASVSDSDGDGLTDAREDTDLDGVVDAGESDPHNDDSDGDGLTDGDEVDLFGSSPVDADSDGDGFTDDAEVDGGTDPTDPDSFLDRCGDADGDGSITLTDVLRVLARATYRESDCPPYRCDASGNGRITAVDVLTVMARLIGTSSHLRCPAA